MITLGSTHGILYIVLLDCFCKSLSLVNKMLIDKLIPGGIVKESYMRATMLLDHMA